MKNRDLRTVHVALEKEHLDAVKTLELGSVSKMLRLALDHFLPEFIEQQTRKEIDRQAQSRKALHLQELRIQGEGVEKKYLENLDGLRV